MATAKEKLRELLSKDLRGIAFSSEKAGEATLETNGISDLETFVGPAPPIYSGEASLYVLRAGVKLLEAGLADFCYLTLTDYIQHAHAPDDPEALEFMAGIDREIGRLLELGVVLGITADHGMNAKQHPDGSPNVLYLESTLTERFGPGCRVLCPITDPYVVHHGALGSAVTVYLPDDADEERSARTIREVARWIASLDGVTEVHDRESAARLLELPPDRIGDLFVLADRHAAIGRTPEAHDLSQLAGPLRSHGGRFETRVPMLLSRPLNPEFAARARADPRNFDIFDFTCNGG